MYCPLPSVSGYSLETFIGKNELRSFFSPIFLTDIIYCFNLLLYFLLTLGKDRYCPVLFLLMCSSTAMFIFLTRSTWTRIIWIYLSNISVLWLFNSFIILICSGNLSNFFSLNFLFYLKMH